MFYLRIAFIFPGLFWFQRNLRMVSSISVSWHLYPKWNKHIGAGLFLLFILVLLIYVSLLLPVLSILITITLYFRSGTTFYTFFFCTLYSGSFRVAAHKAYRVIYSIHLVNIFGLAYDKQQMTHLELIQSVLYQLSLHKAGEEKKMTINTYIHVFFSIITGPQIFTTANM